ncbi:hypothetical protein M1384_04030 [Candidatus Parvarchaeota archaeon]|nr:hypothetical protein [Candidatus Parvarchaeota archaeon]MCL5976444.1 hypothetical protein [Candidatus Parvarchaeota archaeon]
MVNKTFFVGVMIIVMVIAILLIATHLGDYLILIVFANLSTLSNVFVAVIIILVIFNYILLAITKTRSSYHPAGNLGFHEIFGPLGDILNFSFFGFLNYEIFITSTSVIASFYQGKLTGIIPTEPLYTLLLVMLGLLGFSGYTIYIMVMEILNSQALNSKKEAIIIPVK